MTEAKSLPVEAHSSPARIHRIHWLLYWLLKWAVVQPLFRLVLLGRVFGASGVPHSGPLIVVCNHASVLDPPLLSNAMRRPVAFMAKAELFEVPILTQAIRLYGAYPVKRGGADRKAIRATQSALENGWAVGIFLNGTRTADARIPDPHLGAALISARTQTPLLPVALWGTQRVLPSGQTWPRPFQPVIVKVGALIPPPASTDREELLTTTQACVESIHDMLERCQ